MDDFNPSILVVGSINMDLVLQTEVVPSAGETLFGRDYSYVPGGKGANQAVGAARLGGDVTFVGHIGDDAHGHRLKKHLQEESLSTDSLAVDAENQTGLAVIFVEASGENRIVIYPGANMNIGREEIERAFERSYDAVMINFEIPEQAVVDVCELADTHDTPVILDAGPARSFDLKRLRRLDILSPNETEARALTGLECRDAEQAEAVAAKLARSSDAQHIVIKMGKQGAFYDGEGRSQFFPAHEVETVDTTAAGDAFTAALTVHYLKHGDPLQAVEFANMVGALTVTKLGAQPSLPTSADVERFQKERAIRLS